MRFPTALPVHPPAPNGTARHRPTPRMRAVRPARGLRAAATALVIALVGCVEKPRGSSVSCEDCADGQVCVGSYDENAATEAERCVEAPAECPSLQCDDAACRAALDALCPTGERAVSCSPYESVVIVSCNPEDAAAG